MDDPHCLDGMCFVLRQPRFRLGGCCAATPVSGNIIHLYSHAPDNVAPQIGEVSGLKHQHAIARRKSVDDSGFPGACSGSRIDHNRAAGLKNRAESFQYFSTKPGKLRAAMVDNRTIHRPQYAVRDVGGARDLEKVPAAMGHGNNSVLRFIKVFRGLRRFSLISFCSTVSFLLQSVLGLAPWPWTLGLVSCLSLSQLFLRVSVSPWCSFAFWLWLCRAVNARGHNIKPVCSVQILITP